MSIFDALEFLDLADLMVSWRFFLAAAIGIGAGLSVYFSSGETPASAAVAFAFGLAGIFMGLIWQYRHERSQ